MSATSCVHPRHGPRRRRRLLRPATIAVAAALGLPAGAATAILDTEPPVILNLPVERGPAGVMVQAQVLDASGAGKVTLRFRGPGDTDYRSLSMRPARAADTWEGLVPVPEGDESWIAYYLEATDGRGNGPARNGDPGDPFRVEIRQHHGAVERWRAYGTYAAFSAPVALLLLLVLYQPGRKQRDRQFWLELLAPIDDRRGADLERAIDELCSRTHYHPERKEIQVDRLEVSRWLHWFRATEPEALERERSRRRRRGRRQRSLRGLGPEQVREELFWFHVLGGLVRLSGDRLERALHDLAGRAQVHPTQGRRYFDVPTLRRRLERVRRLDPAELLERARGVDDAEGASAGTSLFELLVVLAIVGIFVGIGALALRPLAAPLETAGALIDGLIKQTRSVALATTTVHRIRPLDSDSLIVEHADSCSSVAWTVDPAMALELPTGVALAPTAWSVCFTSRGVATENLILTLVHPGSPARQLEVLKGGAVRWL